MDLRSLLALTFAFASTVQAVDNIPTTPLKVSILKSSAPTGQIQLNSKLHFKNSAGRISFVAELYERCPPARMPLSTGSRPEGTVALIQLSSLEREVLCAPSEPSAFVVRRPQEYFLTNEIEPSITERLYFSCC
jgi:hypothetical protein